MYKEILKLKDMLEKANIPFDFIDGFLGGYQIKILDLCDVIEHYCSYGNEEDLLEIMGALTEEENEHDEVLGYLTAKEVFKRFKYCYENNTSIYKEEK